MKNSTKRIIMSVLTLVLTVVALGTTTFAWFSIGNISTVSGVEGQVQAGDGLEVQISNGIFSTGYLNHLTDVEWNNFLGSVGFNEETPFEFGAVTTSNGSDYKQLAVRTDGNLGFEDAVANKNYIEFQLDFRSLQGGTIALTNLLISGQTGEWDPSGGNAYNQTGAGETNTNHKIISSAAHAARVSFTNDKTTTTFQNPGVAYNVDVDGDVITAGNHFGTTKPVEQGQWSYLQSRNVKVFTNLLESTEITTATLPSQTILAGLDASAVTALTPNDLDGLTLGDEQADGFHYAQVTVRIWIEGWDADAYDAIFERNLEVSFVFKKTTTP